MHRVARVARAVVQARAAAARGLTFHDRLVRLRPHVNVRRVYVVARHLVRAQELDRRALHAVCDVPVPVLLAVSER